jgi:hypothetical protein
MLRAVAAFAVGYLLGTRAGRERYAQIKEVAQKVAVRLEQRGREGGDLGEDGSDPDRSGR